jgi:hypothetical protein
MPFERYGRDNFGECLNTIVGTSTGTITELQIGLNIATGMRIILRIT